mgnify:CR=1 FL=1
MSIPIESGTTEFDDIRPYNDREVRPTIERLLRDHEFLDTVARLLGELGTRNAGRHDGRIRHQRPHLVRRCGNRKLFFQFGHMLSSVVSAMLSQGTDP